MTNKITMSVALVAIAGATTHAYSNDIIYANSVSANNITAIQHSITDTVFKSFNPPHRTVTDIASHATPARPGQDNKSMYGHAPVYGTMPTYGEYGDDGTVFHGRNGGDTAQFTGGDIWMTWRHYNDTAKPAHYTTTDSDYDIALLGINSATYHVGNGAAQFGAYAGYVGGKQSNSDLDIDEKGGYFGGYGRYSINNINISAILNAGTLYNSITHIPHASEYANMWLGTGAQASYTIELDNTLSLQPTLYAGYTWINSADYIAVPDISVANKNFNTFEVTPGIRAIKHIVDGWFGIIDVKYVANFADGGDIYVNGTNLGHMDIRNYTEYGLTIEKSVQNIHISATINRRDGARNGWNGGLELKYQF